MNRNFPLLLLFIFGSSIAFGQSKQVSTSEARSLSVGGEVARALKLSTADVGKLPRQTVNGKDHDGKPVTFEGVALIEVLRLAGVEFGENLRGKSLALFLVADAADGY